MKKYIATLNTLITQIELDQRDLLKANKKPVEIAQEIKDLEAIKEHAADFVAALNNDNVSGLSYSID
jgi:hypothetical protein